MEKKYIKIEGIHCEHCEATIKNALLNNPNIEMVDIRGDIAEISGKNLPAADILVKIILDAGYFTKQEYISENRKKLSEHIKLGEFLIILAVILIVALLLNRISGFNIFNVIPNINSEITYGMLVVTGALTSIHCISMCGAINLSASSESNSVKSYKRPFLYNAGRVISYTVIGGAAGLLGSVFAFSNWLSGCIIVAAALLMLLMSLGMMGVIDFRISFAGKFHIGKIEKRKLTHRNAFVIGLLNGLMPCGPLQAMQLYALSTGSFITGAVSMFLFGIGTVPLMLGVGMLVNVLDGKKRVYVNKVAAVLILVLSVVMLNRGGLYLGIDLSPAKSTDYSDYTVAVQNDEYQQAEINLEYSGYADIVVQAGKPVKLVINAEKSKLTGCNDEVYCDSLGFSAKLHEGENVIEFTPAETGSFTYTCWMNMLKNTILVVDDLE